MNFFASLRLALTRIWAAKTRSALTMLGVVIGVASLVALTSIAQGATSGINSSLSSLGANQVTVVSTTPAGLQERDAELIASLSHVKAVSFQVEGPGVLAINGKEVSTSITGVSSDYAAIAEPELALGSFLPTSDKLQDSTVVVISAQAAQELNFTTEQIGQTLSVAGLPFTVIGVLDDADGIGSQATAYITADAARKFLSQAPYVSRIKVQADSKDSVDAVQSAIEFTVRRAYHLPADADANFTITNQASLQSTVGSITATLNLLMVGISSISLVVGGIGIMNIMLVSVRERTREIGVRRAIGASRRQILNQFLIEAVVLSMVGGLIGLLIGTGFAFLLAQLLDWEFIVGTSTIITALAFSGLVGVVFGVWPARSAARLQPVEALRFE
jgi:putative ABC transport system permease protein